MRSTTTFLSTRISLGMSLLALVACADGIELRHASIVYGTDDRLEFFDVTDSPARDRMARSIVALIPNQWIDRTRGGIQPSVPSWGQAAGLCPGEPFADQPAAAFCTGTLVDRDLILTAGHCVRVLGLEQFSVAFGYYLHSPEQLAITTADIARPVEIVAEAWPRAGDAEVLDYAWIRLEHPVTAAHAPAPIYTQPPPLAARDPLVTIGAASGTPLKLDAAGIVLETRDNADYFVANTDTSGGWSGGGAFDRRLALVGVLARGGPDLFPTDDGCQATQRAADADGEEEFTYAHRAVQALCALDSGRSSICRPDCEQPCEALPFTPASTCSDGGCAIAPEPPAPFSLVLVLTIAFGYALNRRPARGQRHWWPTGAARVVARAPLQLRTRRTRTMRQPLRGPAATTPPRRRRSVRPRRCRHVCGLRSCSNLSVGSGRARRATAEVQPPRWSLPRIVPRFRRGDGGFPSHRRA